MNGTLMICACAKLNLYLDITGVRADGYHLLDMVMQSVSLADKVTLSVYSGEGVTVSCDAPCIPSGERNIAYKAAEGFLKAAGISAAVDIKIEKNIPSGAGMGGGSADAAAVLAGLNRLSGYPLGAAEMNALAVQIGADVPFCLTGGTKICCGIGEEISQAASVRDRYFAVVMPDFTCPTGEAYARYDGSPLPSKNALEEFCGALPHGFEGKMYNAFEALYADERIERIKRTLLEHGAKGAMLTGSGAAVFGVFDAEEKAAQACSALPQYFTAVCEPTDKGVIFIE